VIGQLCTRPAVTAVPETTIQEAAHRMRTRKVGALVVVDGEGRPKGVVTDRDIATEVVATGRDPAEVRVASLVRRAAVTIRDDQGVMDATRLLSRKGVRRLVVVDGAGALVGLLSLDDLLILLGSELGHVASTLAGGLGRARP
jgi:CBS domain-containing protein